MVTLTISEKRQITFPQDVLEHLNIAGGGTLRFKMMPDKSILVWNAKKVVIPGERSALRAKRGKGTQA